MHIILSKSYQQTMFVLPKAKKYRCLHKFQELFDAFLFFIELSISNKNSHPYKG
jgi:hypothetical protein